MAGVHRRPPAEQWLSCRSEVRSPDSAADREHVASVVVVVAAAAADDDDGAGAWH